MDFQGQELSITPNNVVSSVKFITHSGSYHRVKNWKQICIVGIGIRQAPGRPGAHHSDLHQTPIVNTIKQHAPVHVYEESEDKTITYRGIYHMIGTVRRITQEGWVYSEVICELPR
jgi:hypothetical protein